MLCLIESTRELNPQACFTGTQANKRNMSLSARLSVVEGQKGVGSTDKGSINTSEERGAHMGHVNAAMVRNTINPTLCIVELT